MRALSVVVIAAGILVARGGSTGVTPVGPKAVVPTIIYFRAEPSRIIRGEFSTLKWKVIDATAITIESKTDTSLCETPLGSVQPEGSLRVCPFDTTVYVLTAESRAGQAMQSATVRVTEPHVPTNESSTRLR
jgi:hypothetical protein